MSCDSRGTVAGRGVRVSFCLVEYLEFKFVFPLQHRKITYAEEIAETKGRPLTAGWCDIDACSLNCGTAGSSKSMQAVRIVPWAHASELDELKLWFYSRNNGQDLRYRAIQRVKSYQSKGSQYLPHVIDATNQITSAVLMDEASEESVQNDCIAVRLAYTMAMVRFVNGLLDPKQQSQFAMPLHFLAQKAGLSSWFVDLRHWGTHERELPSLDMLRIASKEALDWLWVHYWNDTELETDEAVEESNADTDRYNEDEKMRQSYHDIISNLIDIWIQIEAILNENPWVWLDNKVVRTSKFEAETAVTQSKALHWKSMSPQTSSSKYTELWRTTWRRLRDKPNFMQMFMESNTHQNLLRFCMVRCSGFDLQFVQWLLHTIRQTPNSKQFCILKRHYPSWSKLKEELINLVLWESLSTATIVMRWASWEEIFETQPSYLTLEICLLIRKKFEDQEKASWRKKRRKRTLGNTGDDFTAVYNMINKMIENLAKRYTGKDMIAYDVVPKALSIPSTKRSEISDVDVILDDLDELRKRAKSLEAQTTVKDEETLQLKFWTPVPNWTPRPFGVLG